MCKIGAYLKVFHEGEQFLWETRLMEYKKKYENSRFRVVSWHFPFILVSLAISVLFLYRFEWDGGFSYYEISKIVICFSGNCFVFLQVSKYKNITSKDYIKKWEDIIS